MDYEYWLRILEVSKLFSSIHIWQFSDITITQNLGSAASAQFEEQFKVAHKLTPLLLYQKSTQPA